MMLPKADILGHLGGFITGAIVGLWVMPSRETSPILKERANKTALWAKIATGLWLALLLVLFFTVRAPLKQDPTAVKVTAKALKTPLS